MSDPPYRTELEVRFGDIDHAGIVYYPRFLHYFHVALEEFFATELEVGYAFVMNEWRLGLPTVHLEIDFRRPLRFGDRIAIEVGVEAIGSTSVTWRYRVWRVGDEDLVAEGRQTTVCLDMDAFQKTPVPGWLRQGLEDHVGRVG